MYNFLNSLGMRNLTEDKRKMNKILRGIIDKYDFGYDTLIDPVGKSYFQRFLYMGDNFGVYISGTKKITLNENGEEDERFVIKKWDYFAFGKTVRVNSLAIELNSKTHFCYADEKKTGGDLDFRINNYWEFMEKLAKTDHKNSVNFAENCNASIAMIMHHATIILPICNEESKETSNSDLEITGFNLLEQIQKDLFNYLIPSEMMSNFLEHDEEDDYRETLECLTYMDAYSVLDSYFAKSEVGIEGAYSILADIISVQQLVNKITSENIYKIDVRAAELDLILYIAEKDIVGMPMAGMRISGVGLLQGFIKIDNQL